MILLLCALRWITWEEKLITSHAEKNGKWPVILYKVFLYVALIYIYLFIYCGTFNSQKPTYIIIWRFSSQLRKKELLIYCICQTFPTTSPPQLIEQEKQISLFLLSFPHHTSNPTEAMSTKLLKCILNLAHLSIYTISNIIQTTTLLGQVNTPHK